MPNNPEEPRILTGPDGRTIDVRQMVGRAHDDEEEVPASVPYPGRPCHAVGLHDSRLEPDPEDPGTKDGAAGPFSGRWGRSNL